MLTVNLEQELIKQNRHLATSDELLKVQEYEKLGKKIENDALNRIGIIDSAIEGKQVKNKMSRLKKDTLSFAKERVFHVSQIKGICNKYYLRFLPTKYYKGSVDVNLPERITNFEVAYGTKCNKDNMFIVAPVSSFKLEERPKDPLLFYRINDEYYYLIHKWGNDLSIFNRVKSFLSNVYLSTFIISFVFPLPFLFLKIFQHSVGVGTYIIFAAIVFFCCCIFNYCNVGTDPKRVRFISPNRWDSRHMDEDYIDD